MIHPAKRQGAIGVLESPQTGLQLRSNPSEFGQIGTDLSPPAPGGDGETVRRLQNLSQPFSWFHSESVGKFRRGTSVNLAGLFRGGPLKKGPDDISFFDPELVSSTGGQQKVTGHAC